MKDDTIYGIIYKATCSVNGKPYIGRTISTLPERKAKHKYDSKNPINKWAFSNAIRKHGFESFDWEIVDNLGYFSDDHEELFDELEILEASYIDFFNSYSEGYNSTTGGRGVSRGIPKTHEEEIQRREKYYQANKEKIKTYSKNHYIKTIENESPKERATRLAKKIESNHRHPEDKEAKRLRGIKYRSHVKATETPEKRTERLAKRAVHERNRRARLKLA